MSHIDTNTHMHCTAHSPDQTGASWLDLDRLATRQLFRKE